MKNKRWLIFLAFGTLLLLSINTDNVSYSNWIAGFMGIALIILGLQELNDSNKKRR